MIGLIKRDTRSLDYSLNEHEQGRVCQGDKGER